MQGGVHSPGRAGQDTSSTSVETGRFLPATELIRCVKACFIHTVFFLCIDGSLEECVKEHRIRQIFEVSVLLKGVHALIECIGGLVLAFVSTGAITSLVNTLTQEELIKHPDDFVAAYFLRLAQNLTVSDEHFYALYLLSHGIIKLFLVIGLLRRKFWAYPVSLVVLALFIVYQLYRFSYTHGFGLIVLTVFDVVVMGLIWHEYRLVRRHLPSK
jgi:uncharacterized membrane protein